MQRRTHAFLWSGAAAATANGNSDVLDWPGGSGTFAVYGTFSSGTMKLQTSFDAGTTWIDVASTSFTANNQVNVTVAPCKVRVNLAGAGSPNLKASMVGLPDLPA